MTDTDYKRINLVIAEKELNFAFAKQISEEHALEIIKGPMLIAWFDGKKQEEHPFVPECQHKSGWLAYADGHGGCLRVDVNKDEYSFIFAESSLTED